MEKNKSSQITWIRCPYAGITQCCNIKDIRHKNIKAKKNVKIVFEENVALEGCYAYLLPHFLSKKKKKKTGTL